MLSSRKPDLANHKSNPNLTEAKDKTETESNPPLGFIIVQNSLYYICCCVNCNRYTATLHGPAEAGTVRVASRTMGPGPALFWSLSLRQALQLALEDEFLFEGSVPNLCPMSALVCAARRQSVSLVAANCSKWTPSRTCFRETFG